MKYLKFIALFLCLNFHQIQCVQVDLAACSFSSPDINQCLTNKMNFVVQLIPRMREKEKEISLNDVSLDDLNMDIGTGSISLTNVKLTHVNKPHVERLVSFYDENAKKFRMDIDFKTESTSMSCYANINIVFRGPMAHRKPLITAGNAHPVYTNLRFHMAFEFSVYRDVDNLNYLKLINNMGSFQCNFGIESKFNYKDNTTKDKKRFINSATVNTIMREHSYEFCKEISKEGDILAPFYENFLQNLNSQFEDFGILD